MTGLPVEVEEEPGVARSAGPCGAEVTLALDAAVTLRWFWILRRDGGEPAELVEEARRNYVRARAALLDVLRRESEAEDLAPAGGMR